MRYQRWHNSLPAWIAEELEREPLKQGPLATLQAIANRCDKPMVASNGEPLLVCFGGQSLIDEAGCRRSAFWTHLAALEGRGYVVQLVRGGGRCPNVYGIPGARGQLDRFRAGADSAPRRWDRKKDNRRIRDQVCGNPAPAVRQPDGTAPATGREPSGFRTQPSQTPSGNHRNYSPQWGGVLPPGDAAAGLLDALRKIKFAREGERRRLVREDPQGVRLALEALEDAIERGKRSGRPVKSPAGLFRTLLGQNALTSPAALTRSLGDTFAGNASDDRKANEQRVLAQAAAMKAECAPKRK